MTIHQYGELEWTMCDNCGDIIDGKAPDKKYIQQHPMQRSIVLTVYSMCKTCSGNYKRVNELN